MLPSVVELLLTLGLRRAGAVNLASDRMSAAQSHAQERVLLRPKVRHVGLLAELAGLEGPAVPLIEPSRRHEGGDGRQTDLRACFCIETAKVVTTCPTSR